MKASAGRKKAVPLVSKSHTMNQTAVPLVFGFVQVCDLPASRYHLLKHMGGQTRSEALGKAAAGFLAESTT